MTSTALLSPRKLPRQARAQATVDAILDATAQLLVERGYAQASTNAVAQRAGVSVGSLYQYFPNKIALIAALHDRHVQQMMGVIEQQLARHAGGTLEAAFAAMIDAVVDAHRIDADLHRALDGIHTPEHMGSEQHDQIEAHLQRQLRALLQSHRSEVVVPDLQLATFTLMHMVHALVHACVLDRPPRLSVKALSREITRAAIGYLTTELAG